MGKVDNPDYCDWFLALDKLQHLGEIFSYLLRPCDSLEHVSEPGNIADERFKAQGTYIPSYQDPLGLSVSADSVASD